VATPIQIGKTAHVWNVDVTHVDTGKLIATGRVIMAVREPRRPPAGSK
jgi:acyl-coenzyme A thioesterase PaaI-like protein